MAAGRRELLVAGLVLAGADKASAGLALKGFSTGGFVEYTVADAFKAGAFETFRKQAKLT